MNCYANSLKNCSNIQSKEHIISKNIFEEKVFVQGFSWCLNEAKEISVSKAVAKLLCTKHNNSLSDYDTEAGKFFRFMNEFSEHDSQMKARNYRFVENKKYNVNGLKLERWFVKTFLNIIFANKKEYRDKINLTYLLDVLYNEKNFEEPFGLNIMVRVGDKIKSKDSIFHTPVFDSTRKEIVGALFEFRGVKFLLKIPPKTVNSDGPVILLDEDLKDWDGLAGLWHQNRVQMAIPNSKKIFQIIEFFW
ncbi:hypothetical protein JWG45_13560 [Leptospira sp. 201903070]|uniref:Uncharacterized protein n=1 Tax=Leptospira ainlahdjerensis TaxID=2810033 RepID=A0ABS2UEH5_9LEPT|nr:hypothetical protein [Leptospira ainlahdjerensis]MBM9578179.1 hypothetical protein [Leptospira ainlahdjerensis]